MTKTQMGTHVAMDVPTTDSPESPSASPVDKFARHGPLNVDRDTIERIEAEARCNDPELQMLHEATVAESRTEDAEIEAEIADSPPVEPDGVDMDDPEHDAVVEPNHEEPRALHGSGPIEDDFAVTGDRGSDDAVGDDGSYLGY
ncbi:MULTISPECIES: hypothetical protein [Haloarcula]|uniref:hypothetical protein n=1 Tax=Haloarcula TaxID=2237 RepID=UPI000F8DC71A|nr:MULTISPECIES: hypothetical protein [Haloarcula]NHX41411.1 hypothetical protein [Haloarcula sp. R1-2]